VKRYAYVDLLRGIAAVAVLITHYRFFFVPRFADEWRPDMHLPDQALLWPFYVYGYLAVPLFWALSGFVFAIAYGRYGKDLPVFGFWLRRVSRLYPLHYLTLLVVAALQLASVAMTGGFQIYRANDLPHFILHLFMASNWFTMEPSFNGPIWSVSIEELIYVAFLLYMKRFGLNLRVAALLAIVSFVLWRLTWAAIPECGGLFFVGVGIAILRQRLNLPLIAVVGLALTIVAAWTGKETETALLFLGAPSLLALFIWLDQTFTLPERLHWFGLSTYSIYLWHIPVLIALRLAGYTPPLWLFTGLVLVISYFSYRHIEMPAQAFIRRRWLVQETA
jgi:peptidoglycan/LPS O-acetylase OafA/YrhL